MAAFLLSDEVIYDRSMYWAKLLSQTVDEEHKEGALFFEDILSPASEDELDSGQDDTLENNEILSNITYCNTKNKENTPSNNNNLALVSGIPKQYQSFVDDDDDDLDNVEDIFNHTLPIIAERWQKWKESGMDRVLDTFDLKKINDKVRSWLRDNQKITRYNEASGRSCSFGGDTPANSRNVSNNNERKKKKRIHFGNNDFHFGSEESLQSIDTARYILSNRKRKTSSCTTMTIKTFRYVERKRREIEDKYKCSVDFINADCIKDDNPHFLIPHHKQNNDVLSSLDIRTRPKVFNKARRRFKENRSRMCKCSNTSDESSSNSTASECSIEVKKRTPSHGRDFQNLKKTKRRISSRNRSEYLEKISSPSLSVTTDNSDYSDNETHISSKNKRRTSLKSKCVSNRLLPFKLQQCENNTNKKISANKITDNCHLSASFVKHKILSDTNRNTTPVTPNSSTNKIEGIRCNSGEYYFPHSSKKPIETKTFNGKSSLLSKNIHERFYNSNEEQNHTEREMFYQPGFKVPKLTTKNDQASYNDKKQSIKNVSQHPDHVYKKNRKIDWGDSNAIQWTNTKQKTKAISGKTETVDKKQMNTRNTKNSAAKTTELAKKKSNLKVISEDLKSLSGRKNIVVTNSNIGNEAGSTRIEKTIQNNTYKTTKRKVARETSFAMNTEEKIKLKGVDETIFSSQNIINSTALSSQGFERQLGENKMTVPKAETKSVNMLSHYKIRNCKKKNSDEKDKCQNLQLRKCKAPRFLQASELIRISDSEDLSNSSNLVNDKVNDQKIESENIKLSSLGKEINKKINTPPFSKQYTLQKCISLPTVQELVTSDYESVSTMSSFSLQKLQEKVVLYAPKDSQKLSESIINGRFYLTDEYLKKSIGDRVAEKFLKFNRNRLQREYDLSSTIYFKFPNVSEHNHSGQTSDSDDDLMEKFHKYGELYVSR